MPIGVFDSGLGGLTIYRSLARALPNYDFCYLGDNACAPYGLRDNDDITRLTQAGMERLWQAGCDLIILACNTASAVALHDLQTAGLPEGKRVLGVFVPMIEAITARPWGDKSAPRHGDLRQVALFATPATVASRAFQRELSLRALGVDVEAQPCDGLVEAIEARDLALAADLVRAHITALQKRMPMPQVAVLGCTHYPLVREIFEDVLGANVQVYSQEQLCAQSLIDYLNRHPEFVENTEGGGKTTFLTTGDAGKVSQGASQFLDRPVVFIQA